MTEVCADFTDECGYWDRPSRQYRGNQGGQINLIAFDAFERMHTEWTVFSKTVKGVRFGLKTVKSKVPKLEGKLKVPIASMGLLSVVSVMNCPGEVLSGCQDVREGYKAGDQQGVALGALGVGATFADGVDSGMTVNYSLNGLYDKIPIPEFVSTYMLPLAMGLTAVGFVMRAYSMVQTNQMINEINNFQKSGESLDHFVKRLTGRTEEQLKRDFDRELKEAVGKRDKRAEKNFRNKEMRKLSRQLPHRAVECLTSLKKADDLEQIKTLAERRIKVGYVALVSSLATFVALTLLFFSVVAPYIPLAMLTALAFVKLGIYVYETQTMYRGLDI